jgi:hypothetical protein
VEPRNAYVRQRNAGGKSNDNAADPNSLRYAVNRAANGDTINFRLAFPATITLTSVYLEIATNVTIKGPGAANLFIRSSQMPPCLTTTIFLQRDVPFGRFNRRLGPSGVDSEGNSSHAPKEARGVKVGAPTASPRIAVSRKRGDGLIARYRHLSRQTFRTRPESQTGGVASQERSCFIPGHRFSSDTTVGQSDGTRRNS